jgi:hypothetical protein
MRTPVLLVAGTIAVTAAVGAGLRAQSAQPPAGAPTFTRDIAPILYANCVECHRAGEIAPMSLITYAEVRPWARAIERRVMDGTMPPWHADAAHGTFRNERQLTAPQKDAVQRWAAAGAPEGDAADLPAPPAFAAGWRIGAPDVILEMQEDYAVPASGTVRYEYFYIPTNFTETKWVRAIEARPGNRSLVHHILVFHEAPSDGSNTAPVIQPNREDSRTPPPPPQGNRPSRRPAGPSQLIATYAPGTNPQEFPAGTALRLPPGGTLRLQMHYTATGTAGSDRSRIGLIFAKEPPAEEIRVSHFLNGQLVIPAGASDHQVSTDVTFVQDASLWGLFPHTHVRGKRWNYMLELPDGTTKPLLAVPKYDFNWQTYYIYQEPLRIPKGAKIRSTAWYDNSAANRSNPDPTIDVKWGDQTWEEMQYTGIMYSVKR